MVDKSNRYPRPLGVLEMIYVIQQKIDGEWETVAHEHTVQDLIIALMDYQRNMHLGGLSYPEVSELVRCGILVEPGTVAVIDHFDFNGGE